MKENIDTWAKLAKELGFFNKQVPLRIPPKIHIEEKQDNNTTAATGLNLELIKQSTSYEKADYGSKRKKDNYTEREDIVERIINGTIDESKDLLGKNYSCYV